MIPTLEPNATIPASPHSATRRAPAPSDAIANDPTRWALEAGSHIGPELWLLERLGGGDRYEAWVAWDDRLLAPVVVKLLRPHLLSEARSRRAMEREVQALLRLSHPVLVRPFGADLDAPVPYLTLELLEGPRLSTLLRRHGPLSAEQAVLLARQLASALHYIAGEGWVHLDVKPRNVIVTATPRLIDLSVARPMAVARRTSGVGTGAYMAPEQIDPRRSGEIGPPSDVFGLGATVYEALTARQAFPSLPDDPHPQLGVDRPALPPKTPHQLAALVTAALDPDPARRPAAARIHDELDDLAVWAGRSARRLR